jgi:pimeloyl-ACP methyl ester carboxylesterase
MSIPFFTLGGVGFPLNFLHANGYPPECYKPLILRLSAHYQDYSMRQRPLWPNSKPEEISDWNPLTDDYLCFLDEQKITSSISVGHSVGGIAALRAALRHPELFRALVLIDPVLFPPIVIRAWQVIRYLGLGYPLHPLVLAARNRRQQFDDLDRLFTGYRRRPVFKYMDDAALRAYIEGIACPGEHGYKLCYSAEWEMRIYYTSIWRDMDIWQGLHRLKIPFLIIRGEQTDTFWASTAQRVRRIVPAVRIITIPQASHLVALERPDEVFEAIQEFLEENL